MKILFLLLMATLFACGGGPAGTESSNDEDDSRIETSGCEECNEAFSDCDDANEECDDAVNDCNDDFSLNGCDEDEAEELCDEADEICDDADQVCAAVGCD